MKMKIYYGLRNEIEILQNARSRKDIQLSGLTSQFAKQVTDKGS